ncbi:hypothetical protein ACFSDD_09365 [Salipiger marinus]|jgi:hypothetical protein|uniref:Uncharacterized protein n=2 Tax=Salipiger marinus TaxID=555512 RepID=A0A1G8JG93_9RHOB|nr:MULTISPECIES: hypothetical protein [Salipiger]MEB3420377.1 hypothetical protein [Salipiger manganoxidans]SDI30299.1 hypothetical protein SAMN04487993_100353 [Salipiger marinus]
MSAETTFPVVPMPAQDSIIVLLRMIVLVAGVTLWAAALTIWLVPTSEGLPALQLVRLGLSLFLALTGTACLLGGRSQPQQGPQPRPLRE